MCRQYPQFQTHLSQGLPAEASTLCSAAGCGELGPSLQGMGRNLRPMMPMP